MQDQQQPGWTFQPGQQVQPQSSPEQPIQQPQPPMTEAPTPQPNSESAPTPSHEDNAAITWTASEYVAHEKGGSWFVQFALAAFVLIVATYFITHSLFTVAVFVIFAIGFVVLAQRKPQVLTYQLSDNLIRIGEKAYPLNSFKSFAVIEEGNLDSISLTPMKRFMPALDIYFAPNDEARIVDFLSDYLPVEHRKQDMIDQFMRKIRF